MRSCDIRIHALHATQRLHVTLLREGLSKVLHRCQLLIMCEGCALDGACGWVDAGDAVCQPNVSPNLSVHILELIQSIDLKSAISHLQGTKHNLKKSVDISSFHYKPHSTHWCIVTLKRNSTDSRVAQQGIGILHIPELSAAPSELQDRQMQGSCSHR